MLKQHLQHTEQAVRIVYSTGTLRVINPHGYCNTGTVRESTSEVCPSLVIAASRNYSVNFSHAKSSNILVYLRGYPMLPGSMRPTIDSIVPGIRRGPYSDVDSRVS